MKLFDAHNHLQDYPSEDALAAAMRAGAEAGVEGMLCCGTEPDDWGRVLELAGRYEGVTPCFGLHPWRSAEDGWQEKLEEFVRRAPCCVGEIGLDALNGRPGQEEQFVFQLQLAARFGRPAVIHCVKSWGRLLELLKKAAPKSFMLHAYGGSPEMTGELAALGGYFSFGGEIMDPKREKLRAALKAAPPGRLLFETESPAPDSPPWRAGPAGVADVVEAAANLMGLTPEELAELSLANGLKFAEGAR